MIGKHNQAVKKPTIQDIMQQTSTYGATIPLIMGTMLQPPLLIWMNGLQKHSHGKKSGKKGNQTYTAQLDMLLGHNPILGTLRCWENGPSVGLQCWWNKINVGAVGSYTVADAAFVCVIGLTTTLNFSETFNDYGSNGPVTESGTYELPLWNTAVQGPDPTDASGYRWAPYTYHWLPGSNQITEIKAPGLINVYYATFPATGWGAGKLPLAQVLNCFFESSLGDGSEYTSPNDYSAQRIVYPMFAGVGSNSFDLGSGAMPQVKIETLGTCCLYPDGYGNAPATHVNPPDPGGPFPAADADYADMIELIFKQGQAQAALLSTGVGEATGQSPIQSGCSSFNYPGTVQKKFWGPTYGSFSGTMKFDKPLTLGNIVAAMVAAPSTSGAFGIASANSWTTVSDSGGVGFWYGTVTSATADTVTFSGVPTNADVILVEIGGVDTVDAVSLQSAGGVSSLPTATVVTTQAPNQSSYLLAWVFPDFSGSTGSGSYAFWRSCIASVNQGGNFYGSGTSNSFVQQRVVSQPGTYQFTGNQATTLWNVVLMACKTSVAPNYPKPFFDLLDADSLNQVRMQCRANGLWGSILMNSQKKASDWLNDIYDCAVAAPVYSGSHLKSIPYSEVSAAGNGAVYVAPTASGPIPNLTIDDAVAASDKPWIVVERKAITDRQNLQRIDYPDRNNQYRNGSISQPDQGALVLRGLRYGTPKKLEMVVHAAQAKQLLGIFVRRANQLVRTYKFTLQARWKLLEAMDLVTVTDYTIGVVKQPVRLTSVEEDDKFNLQCEAVDFIYGLNDPNPLPVTASQPVNPPSQYTPAAVNTPIFLEPPGALAGVAQDQLKIIVSDSDAQYGGCRVYASVDGSTGSYFPLSDVNGSSLLFGNATTGFTVGDWPQALDPDTTNDLAVDLTESLGQLTQYVVTQEDQGLYPYYVAGSGIYPFELMSYAVANLTSAYHYTLKATGGGTNHLKRALYGTWVNATTPNTGSDHPNNSRFAFVDPSGVGVMTVNVPTSWIGKTIWFKFVQFNQFQGGAETLAAATPYSYTILGNQNGPGGGAGGSGGSAQSSYTIDPLNPLSQTTATNIHMVNVTASWSPSGLKTFYVARNFTIVAPVSPTTYWVTIYDPNQTGDTGGTATLTAYYANTQAAAHVGQAGYVYMGSIVATASGSSAGGQSGGSNPSGSSVVYIPIPSTTRGDFQIAHGLGKTPSDVDIKIQSDGLIRFQSPTMWDATNVYLSASDDGLTGTLVIEL